MSSDVLCLEKPRSLDSLLQQPVTPRLATATSNHAAFGEAYGEDDGRIVHVLPRTAHASSSHRSQGVVVVTMPPLATVLPALPRQQSRATSVDLRVAASDSNASVAVALTKEPFPLHCPWCNRTVVTEPQWRATRGTWLACALLSPMLLCFVPVMARFRCDVEHCCGRCRRVIARWQPSPPS